MTDAFRSPYDRALGVTEQDHQKTPFARYRAITARLGEALEAQNWPAAQVYALLMITEGQQGTGNDVNINWPSWEDHALAIAAHLAPHLDRLTDAIDRLDR